MNKIDRLIQYTCLIVAFLSVFYMSFSFYTSMQAREPQTVNEQVDDRAPKAYIYFEHAAPAVYHLARKIERQDPNNSGRGESLSRRQSQYSLWR